MSASKKRVALVVLGMHRSGTSAMARVLSLVGGQLPQRVMAANSGNETGYWEPQDVADLNDQILEGLDSSWDDILGPRRARQKKLPLDQHIEAAAEVIRKNFDGKDFIVFKEPRTAILLDLWKDALRREGFELRFVIMVRNPLEIAASLNRRDKFVKQKAILLWATYMVACELGTRNERRIFVRYDELLDSSEAVLDRIEGSFGFDFPRRTWDAAGEAEEFLDVERRHHRKSDDDNELLSYDLVANFYKYLNSASRDEPWNHDASRELVEWLNKLDATVGPIFKQFARDLRRERAELAAVKEAAAEGRRNLEAAEVRLTDLRKEADGFRSRAEALEVEFASAWAESESRQAELREAAEGARARADAFEAEFARARAEADELASRLAAALAEKEAAARLVAQSEAALIAAREAAEAAAREAAEAAARDVEQKGVREAEERLVQARHELSELRANAAARETTLQAKLRQAEADLQSTRAQSQALARELSRAITSRRRGLWGLLGRVIPG